MGLTKDEQLAKRRVYENRPEFRARYREHRSAYMKEFYERNEESAHKNRVRAAERARYLRALAWVAQIFQEPVVLA